MKKIIIGILIIVALHGSYVYFSKPWQLSLYSDNATLLRADYNSKDACLSAGNAYYRDGNTQYKRFDCGYKCSYLGDKNDLSNAPVCSQICDSYGCE